MTTAQRQANERRGWDEQTAAWNRLLDERLGVLLRWERVDTGGGVIALVGVDDATGVEVTVNEDLGGMIPPSPAPLATYTVGTGGDFADALGLADLGEAVVTWAEIGFRAEGLPVVSCDPCGRPTVHAHYSSAAYTGDTTACDSCAGVR